MNRHPTPTELASNGFHVFPLAPGSKEPIKGVSWKMLSTNDPERIGALSCRYPNCNWAIDTGASGLLVVDIDEKPDAQGNPRNGLASWKALAAEHGGAGKTLAFRTPTGGYHLVFSGKAGQSAGRLGKGLDTRSSGGYIVAPGSSIGGARYEVLLDADVAPAPGWLVGLLGEKRKRSARGDAADVPDEGAESAARSLLESLPGAVFGSGSGNHDTYVAACKVRGAGVKTPERCIELMERHWCPRCEPPYEPGDENLETTVRNAYRYAGNGVGTETALFAFQGYERPQGYSYAEPAPVADGGWPKASSILRVRGMQERLEAGMREPPSKRLFDSLVFEDETTVLFASMGVGKTVLGMQLADALSRGSPVAEGFLNESAPSKVLYLDFELSDKQMALRYGGHAFHENLLVADISPDAELSIDTDYAGTVLSCLEQALDETDAKTVVLDNITFLANDITQAEEAIMLMKKLKKLKMSRGLTLIVIAHTPKRDDAKPLTRNDLSGSANFGNFVDAMVGIGRVKGCADLRYVKQLKTRSDMEKYHAGNVAMFRLRKPEGGFLRMEHIGERREEELLKGCENPSSPDSVHTRRRDFIAMVASKVLEPGEYRTMRWLATKVGEESKAHPSTRGLFGNGSTDMAQRAMQELLGDAESVWFELDAAHDMELFKSKARMSAHARGCLAEYGVRMEYRANK
jgi:KaiC/GvpD/RAD55 family RecA-like ATPase